MKKMKYCEIFIPSVTLRSLMTNLSDFISILENVLMKYFHIIGFEWSWHEQALANTAF